MSECDGSIAEEPHEKARIAFSLGAENGYIYIVLLHLFHPSHLELGIGTRTPDDAGVDVRVAVRFHVVYEFIRHAAILVAYKIGVSDRIENRLGNVIVKAGASILNARDVVAHKIAVLPDLESVAPRLRIVAGTGGQRSGTDPAAEQGDVASRAECGGAGGVQFPPIDENGIRHRMIGGLGGELADDTVAPLEFIETGIAGSCDVLIRSVAGQNHAVAAAVAEVIPVVAASGRPCAGK